MSLLEITFWGTLAGVIGTAAGGALTIFFGKPSRHLTGTVLAFAAGVMLVIVFLELTEEAISFGGHFAAITGLSAGMALFYLLDLLIPHHHAVTAETGGADKAYLRKGTLLALGIALHNLPEGVAIGAGFIGSERLGVTLAILIALHNIPEGLAVAVPLRQGGRSYTGALMAAALAGLPMGLGAFIGAAVAGFSMLFLGLAMAFAAGAMLYIVCDEMIPDAYASAGPHLAILGIFLGTVTGMTLLAWL